jgi:ABC-type sugar transport system substrate-binding protein
MRYGIRSLVAALALFAFAGDASAQSKKPNSQLKFAFSVMIMDNPYFIAVKKGFEDRCKELGIQAIVNDAKYDAATQFGQVENYTAMGVDAIVVAPVDSKSIMSAVEKAKAKKIIVVSEAQGIDNADANVIVNDYEYGVAGGKNAAKWINEKLGGKAEVAIVAQDNVEAVIKRGNGIEETLKKLSPNAKIVARQTGDTPELAMKIAETVMQAHPNVKVWQCVNDSGALGVYQAIKAMGKNTADFYVGGADATAEALAKMKEKDSIYRATVDIDPYGTGKKCVDVALDYLRTGVKHETFYFEMKPIWQSALK